MISFNIFSLIARYWKWGIVFFALVSSGNIICQGSDSVCAEVRLHLEQRAVISRTAFKARLQLSNNKTSDLQQLKMTLVISDSNKAPAEAKFGITGPILGGVSAVDGTGVLEVDKTGVIEWTIVPTADAAVDGPTLYSVGGQLSYVTNGVIVTVPFYPAPITVFPEANLKVKYFWQQSVSSDDAFTPQIEPSVPFVLGLLVDNTGLGIAKNLSITSAQPTITKNDKGLLAGFQLIASQVGNQQVTPSFTVKLGDIAAGGSAVALWYLTSSLQGDFLNFQAGYRHVDDLGNPRTSLVEGIETHDLSHVVRIETPQDDEIPDFLANDQPDSDRLPDTLYSSDGTISPVAAVTSGIATVQAATATVNSTMPSGWSYLRINDPFNGQSSLISVQRSDGKSIRVPENAWTTKRTVHPVGEPARTETFFHLLDSDSTGSYTLTFGVPPGTIQFASHEYSVERTDKTAAIEVLRTGALDGRVSVFYATEDDSAVAGSDYTQRQAMLTFAAGESVKKVAVPILKNTSTPVGVNKSFTVVLSQISGKETLGTPAGTRVAIVNALPRIFLPVVGNYLGLVSPQIDGGKGNGSLRITVGKTGGFTATLILAGKSYSFTGAFDRNGVFTQALITKGLPPVLLALQIDVTTGTGKVTGTATANGAVSDIESDINSHETKGNPSPFVGTYNVLLPPSSDPTLPQGYGYGKAVVSPKGKGTFTATLADGTKLSQGFIVTNSETWPLLAIQKGPGESLFGTIAFSKSASPMTLAGQLTWTRPQQPAAPLFPSGFSGSINLNGSIYKAPKGTERVMSVADAGQNATIVANDGDLTAPLTKLFTLGAKSKIDLAPSGSDKFILQIAPATGSFNGTFFDAGTRKTRKFRGLFIQSEPLGAGYFLGDDASGSITISPSN